MAMPKTVRTTISIRVHTSPGDTAVNNGNWDFGDP